MKTLLCFLVSCVLTSVSYGQSAKETAEEKGRSAVELMDNGKIEEALVLLKESRRLDPANITYPYETAYAYYLSKDYKAAIAALQPLLKHKDCFGRVYQLLGNAYDLSGDAENAIAVYEQGIKKFPNAGELYLERGNMELMQKRYTRALPYYEKGIEQAPAFPSNYYWAAKIYCGSVEEVWGMIYGETFMNLERDTKRTEEISKLLYDTYRSEIKFSSDSTFSVSFSKNGVIDPASLARGKVKLPFGVGVYEPLLSKAIIGERDVNVNSLSRIRTRFVKEYWASQFAAEDPNVLFQYQKQVLDAGHMEAYNHWLLLKGDENDFRQWLSGNREKWDAFMNWYADNKIKISRTPGNKGIALPGAAK
ncbi:tetratricopeptide repeat protein [Arcticibacter sp. MXS-1]|uniref:tetratricopeptide repeat protein n=1 Tax=Arcticibacter sp. MXS-1 TaxID=3341726 RepID=UPI0035A9A7EA